MLSNTSIRVIEALKIFKLQTGRTQVSLSLFAPVLRNAAGQWWYYMLKNLQAGTRGILSLKFELPGAHKNVSLTLCRGGHYLLHAC